MVLVIAPDRDFRRSLEFALEAEGFRVFAHDGIDGLLALPRSGEVACAVVDDTALESRRSAAEEFMRFGKPVLFLSDWKPLPLDLPNTVVLTKPFLGGPLIDAVRSVIGGGAST